MAYYTAFFPGKSGTDVTGVYTSLGIAYKEIFPDRPTLTHRSGDSVIMTAGSGTSTPVFFSDDRGWIVVSGVLFDVSTPNPLVTPEALLEQIIEHDGPIFERYEGNFTVACWDEHRQKGWAFNDQLAVMNLYCVEHHGGLFLTTAPVPLARALGLALDPLSVQDFLVRGDLLAPQSMFAGMRRLNIGEDITFDRQRGHRLGRHWVAYRDPIAYGNAEEAAVAFASVFLDRIRRFAAVQHPIVTDLTGGYDSRLIVLTELFAGLDVHATVNGPDDHPDVVRACDVARAVGIPLLRFRDNDFSEPVTPEMRRELTCRTHGELPFTGALIQRATRPVISQTFRAHFNGAGGGIARYYPWGQEFFGIGRRRRANIENLLKYRFLQAGPPPHRLMSRDMYTSYIDSLRRRITDVCEQGRNTLTTQQCDAVHTWKGTSHVSLYCSAHSDWLPALAPYMTAGVFDLCISLPWHLRLTSGLMRHVNQMFSPRGAAVLTNYGGPAAPLRASNVHRFAWQGINNTGHMLAKVTRVMCRKGHTQARVFHLPYMTEEFRAFLTPEKMLSRGLYSEEGLAAHLQGTEAQWYRKETYIVRIATLEQLCRETGFEPDRNFLSDSRGCA